MALGRERKQSEVDEEPIEKGKTTHKYSSGFAFYRFWPRHFQILQREDLLDWYCNNFKAKLQGN